jgi:hypothetical protein
MAQGIGGLNMDARLPLAEKQAWDIFKEELKVERAACTTQDLEPPQHCIVNAETVKNGSGVSALKQNGIWVELTYGSLIVSSAYAAPAWGGVEGRYEAVVDLCQPISGYFGANQPVRRSKVEVVEINFD